MKNLSSITQIKNFEPEFAALLPETHALLAASNLFIHPSVFRIVLHGSRGPSNRYRPDSDLDLSLIVDVHQEQYSTRELNDILETTLQNWDSELELDLAVVFDTQRCGLNCFDQTAWKKDFCHVGRVDCFGLYKTQKGFMGLVRNAGIQVQMMSPCLKIWQRKDISG